MISPHFKPIERSGFKWDAGSILYEFSALREPEATQFPKIGEYLRGLGMEFNEVKPTMLWCGNIVPDLYIANQLDAVPLGWFSESMFDYCDKEMLKLKREWNPDHSLYEASRLYNGEKFHAAFIEPFCQKVTGIPSQEIIAKYHRSVWLPLYWPETLRERKSIETRFWYPRKGYAGIVYERYSTGNVQNSTKGIEFDTVEITLTFILAKPMRAFQTLFVVDKSPIYRVTDQDACAGMDVNYHRFVVESREYCQDITDEMQRLNLLSSVQYSSQLKIKMPLPTLANYRRGWRPAPHLNQQLLEHMNAATA